MRRIRMRVAVYANARTTVTALDAGQKGWTGSFNCAFQSGAIMGFSLCGLSIFVLYVMCLIYRDAFTVIVDEARFINYTSLFECISGFGLGGSCIALFGRVGGGIFTKAADVGADLSGSHTLGPTRYPSILHPHPHTTPSTLNSQPHTLRAEPHPPPPTN
jgi:inorganic pyrophosphatase